METEQRRTIHRPAHHLIIPRAVHLAHGSSRKVRRVRGRPWATWGAGCPPAPGGSREPPREPLRGSPGPFGVPWVALAGARVGGDFCPGPSFGFPLHPVAGAWRSHLEPLKAGNGLLAIAGVSPLPVSPDLLELGAPTRGPTFQAPVLATLGAGSERPVASNDSGNCRMRRNPRGFPPGIDLRLWLARVTDRRRSGGHPLP